MDNTHPENSGSEVCVWTDLSFVSWMLTQLIILMTSQLIYVVPFSYKQLYTAYGQGIFRRFFDQSVLCTNLWFFTTLLLYFFSPYHPTRLI